MVYACAGWVAICHCGQEHPLRRTTQGIGKAGLVSRFRGDGPAIAGRKRAWRQSSRLMLDELPVETTLYSLRDSPPGPPERRAGERHLTLLRVGSLIIGDRRELCLIKNVSAGGMLIRAYCDIALGTADLDRAKARRADRRHRQMDQGRLRWSDLRSAGRRYCLAFLIGGRTASAHAAGGGRLHSPGFARTERSTAPGPSTSRRAG